MDYCYYCYKDPSQRKRIRALDRVPTFLFLPHFDVICGLLLKRRTATWSLFVKLTAVFLCVCPVIDHELRHNIVKVAASRAMRFQSIPTIWPLLTTESPVAQWYHGGSWIQISSGTFS